MVRLHKTRDAPKTAATSERTFIIAIPDGFFSASRNSPDGVAVAAGVKRRSSEQRAERSQVRWR